MSDKAVQTPKGDILMADNNDGTMTELMGLRQAANSTSVTIASGAAVSSAVDATGRGPRGIAVETPSAWTAANIGFEASTDGTTYYKLYGETGSRVLITTIGTAAAGLYMAPADTWVLGSYEYFRLVSVNTSTGADLNQGAARTVKVKMLS